MKLNIICVNVCEVYKEKIFIDFCAFVVQNCFILCKRSSKCTKILTFFAKV